jgi:hypothetical protein
MLKILIIDDLELKSDILSNFIYRYCPSCKISYAISYAMAIKNIGKKYDWVICDQNLGDGLGSDVLTMFINNGCASTCLLYSSEDQDSVIGDWKCYTFETVQTQILALINQLTKESEVQQMDHKGDVFNKENCELKHSFLEKTMQGIDKKMGEFSNDSKLTTRLVFGIFLTQFLAIGLKYFNIIK